MRKSRFTESQIVDILKQGEAGVPIAEILRQHNISKANAEPAGVSVAGLGAPHRLAQEANDHDFRGVRPRRRSLSGKGQTFEGNN